MAFSRSLRFLVLAITLAGLPLLAPAQIADEQKLKIAFIYNFFQFIDWPAEAFSAPDQAITVCVFGKDSFDGGLIALTKRTARQRPIEVAYPDSLERAKKCHLLYLEDTQNPSHTALLKGLSQHPVLTVSTGGDIASGLVAVDFTRHDGRLRLALNLDTLRKAQLRVNAKMIEVALTVYGKSGAS